jgi:hypothetical protein
MASSQRPTDAGSAATEVPFTKSLAGLGKIVIPQALVSAESTGTSVQAPAGSTTPQTDAGSGK